MLIEETALTPDIERRNASVYNNTLFGRDDQLIQTLNAGINAGQHEGGGKSLEIRRFGFNTDHGGVNGGVKILVDNIQQNQGTQGHGQGYLGNLKSLSPELVEDVSIINGPFSAAYGDFGLGVVKIIEGSLPDSTDYAMQAGSSTHTGIVPTAQRKEVNAFIDYELSQTDGPFQTASYRRENVRENSRANARNAVFGVSSISGAMIFTRRDRFRSTSFCGRRSTLRFYRPGKRRKSQARSLAGFSGRKELRRDPKATLYRAALSSTSNFRLFKRSNYGDEINRHDSRPEGSSTIFKPYNVSHQTRSLLAQSFANQINADFTDDRRNRIANPAENIIMRILFHSANAESNHYAGILKREPTFKRA